MIKQWTISNFKSIRDQTLPMAPLTIFAGPNSSGKSTVLQSILLVAQTLEYNVGARPIVLNGSLSKLGQFDDLKSEGTDADHILIGWRCEPNEAKRINWVESKLSFDANLDSDEREKDIYQLQPRLHKFELTANLSRLRSHTEHPIDNDVRVCISSLNPGAEKEKKSRLKECEGFGELKNTLLFDIVVDEDSLSDIREESLSDNIVGCKLHHFLPQILTIRIDRADEIALKFIIALSLSFDIRKVVKADKITFVKDKPLLDKGKEVALPVATLIKSLNTLDGVHDQIDILRKKLGNMPEKIISLKSWRDLVNFDFETRKTIYDHFSDDSIVEKMIEPIREYLTSSSNFISHRLISVRCSSASPDISLATEYINKFFSQQVKYLGPLRDEPKSLYPLGTLADTADVGLRGEQTAAALYAYREHPVEYLPATNFKLSEMIERTRDLKPLRDAVRDWMQYLEIAEDVETRDRGKLGHELKIDPGGDSKHQDLTHVGVGVSQVLPILVMGLLAEEDTTLIFEQPELHLHPRVQTRLADFFLSMALLNKQCIVETHSEHLINRLRFRIAAEPPEPSEPKLIDTTKIYFVKKEKKEGTSQFEPVEINEYGAIKNWPSGFFDQSTSEADKILREAIKKRKKMHKDN